MSEGCSGLLAFVSLELFKTTIIETPRKPANI